MDGWWPEVKAYQLICPSFMDTPSPLEFYLSILLLHDLPQSRLMNEMCEHPRVFVHEWKCRKKVEKKGERQIALCPFQPSVSLSVCQLRPTLFSVPSFSCCQSSLSFCHFVLHLKKKKQQFFLTSLFLFCHNLFLPCFVLIYCLLLWSYFSVSF